MTKIAGKAAVVTGGGSGLGKGVAIALATEGARVVVADILKENAEATATAIRETGGEAIAVVCDVSDRAAVRALKQAANEAFGPIQIVIPNAGATSFKPMTALTDDEIDWIVEVNFMGVMNFLQIFLPDLIAAGDGHIVASASVAGLVPILMENHVPYSGAKAGVIGMTVNLQRELEGTGVQSTVFLVASVAGDMKEQNSLYRPERFGGPYREDIVPPTSFRRGRPRPPAEVAPMVIEAIRNNRPMLVSDPSYREWFDRYVTMVHEAFDDVDRFYAARPEHQA
jgi:NAD(P)-dependent dehydrogenase (short-subunit alcohol dehydrogenase family)